MEILIVVEQKNFHHKKLLISLAHSMVPPVSFHAPSAMYTNSSPVCHAIRG